MPKYINNIFSQMVDEDSAAAKPVAVVSLFGENENVEKIEVSIIDPHGRSVAYKSWNNEGRKSLNQVTDEVIGFATKHRVGEIRMLDALSPIST